MPRKHPKEGAQEGSWGIRCVSHSFPLINKEAVDLLWAPCGRFSSLPYFDPLLKPELEQKLIWWPGFDPWGPVCQSAVEQATTLWTDHLQLWATWGVLLAGQQALFFIFHTVNCLWTYAKVSLNFLIGFCVFELHQRNQHPVFDQMWKYTFSVSLITLQFTSAPVCPSWAQSVICIL